MDGFYTLRIELADSALSPSKHKHTVRVYSALSLTVLELIDICMHDQARSDQYE